MRLLCVYGLLSWCLFGLVLVVCLCFCGLLFVVWVVCCGVCWCLGCSSCVSVSDFVFSLSGCLLAAICLVWFVVLFELFVCLGLGLVLTFIILVCCLL